MINPAKLKELRNTKKQSDVANEIGISQNHYSQIENGLKNPSLGIATRIAEFFDVSVDEILTNPPPKISSDVKDVEVIDNQRSVKEENVGVVQVNIRTRIKLRGVVEVETTYGIQEPGINANVIT
ncbi:MAG: helix-turn-helix domain-containing protein, partial [Synergistaceae bacterium]|nr:helix-turn-helix domain-containing protein [Synergistaceae bacterium]